MSYPEHEKLQAISDMSQAIGEFLVSLEEKGWRLCEIPPEYEHTYVPVYYVKEKLLAEYFDIDLDKIENEKRAMLKVMRGASG